MRGGGGGRLRATAEDDALVVEPLDPPAFARLLSEEPPDEMRHATLDRVA